MRREVKVSEETCEVCVDGKWVCYFGAEGDV